MRDKKCEMRDKKCEMRDKIKDEPAIHLATLRTMVLPELSRTMAYTTRKTVNRQLHLNNVVSERPKEE